MTGGVVTVPGADGHSVLVTVQGAMAFQLAQQYALVLNGAASSGNLYVSSVDATPPGFNPHMSHPVNEFVATSGGVYSYADGYQYFITDTPDHVVITPTGGYTTTVRDTLVGTGGATYTAGNEAGTFVAGGGNNIFQASGNGNYTIVTSDGDDKIFVQDYGVYTIDAGTGNNLLMLGKNADTITSEGTDQIFMGTGPDTISILGKNTHVYGSSGTLYLDDTKGDGTVLEGESGSASIFGGKNSSYQVQGTSTVTAGVNDTVSAAGSTTIFGGANTHVFDSGSGSLLFIGEVGSTSTVNAGSAAATITSAGTDQIFTSTGTDTISVLGKNTQIHGSSGNVFIDDTQGQGTVLEGESGLASIIGGKNSSYQVQGTSTISAGSSDTISAAGNTTVFGGADTHVFDSGSSSLLFISQAGSTSTVNSGSAAATVFGSLGSSIIYNGSGIVTTQGGDETINGAGSALGFTGTIDGQAGGGRTHLLGGSGNDTLIAGQGSQTISGGLGKNMFDISAYNTESNASITISDFGKSTGNLVNLFGYGANEVAATLKSAVTHAGSTTVTLADSTQVTFINVSHLNSSMFTG